MKFRLYICRCGNLQIRQLFKDENFPKVICSNCNEEMKSIADKQAIQRLYEILFL